MWGLQVVGSVGHDVGSVGRDVWVGRDVGSAGRGVCRLWCGVFRS